MPTSFLRSLEDIGRLKVKGDLGEDHQADGPLEEGSAHRPGGDAEVKGATREGRAARGGEEEDEAVEISYQDNVLSGKLRQDICQATAS